MAKYILLEYDKYFLAKDRIPSQKYASLANSNNCWSSRIGDNWKDIFAGVAAGCATILLDKYYNKSVDAEYRLNNLGAVAKLIKSHDNMS